MEGGPDMKKEKRISVQQSDEYNHEWGEEIERSKVQNSLMQRLISTSISRIPAMQPTISPAIRIMILVIGSSFT